MSGMISSGRIAQPRPQRRQAARFDQDDDDEDQAERQLRHAAAAPDSQSLNNSSSGMMSSAPTSGPATVPTPPTMHISATRTEMPTSENTVSGSKK